MQVICVKQLVVSVIPAWAEGMTIPLPVVRNEYTVTGALVKADGLLYYNIVGFIDTDLDARAFAIIPELSADEIDDLEKESIRF